MPSLVTLPFIQCHQTRGLADWGGLRNASSRLDAGETGGSARAVPGIRAVEQSSTAVIIPGRLVSIACLLIAFDS